LHVITLLPSHFAAPAEHTGGKHFPSKQTCPLAPQSSPAFHPVPLALHSTSFFPSHCTTPGVQLAATHVPSKQVCPLLP
jgi:hypothetical protein